MENKLDPKKPSYTLIERFEDYDLIETRAGQRFKLRRGKQNALEDFKKYIPQEEYAAYESAKKANK